MFEISMAGILALMSFNEHLSQTNTSLRPEALLPVGMLSYAALPCQDTCC
jgi:hypothetical protein